MILYTVPGPGYCTVLVSYLYQNTTTLYDHSRAVGPVCVYLYVKLCF